MNIFDSIILGFVQGVGEFLPISSSAHLFLTSYIFNFKYQGLAFDVMLHIGTLFAIFIYFYRDIISIISNSIKDIRGKDATFLINIIIATIPGGVCGVLLEHTAENIFRTPIVISLSLIFFSIVIYAVDRKGNGNKTEYELTSRDALIAGLFQAIAIIPGASRSGMTIIALLILGYSRYSAARISFFMSMPIIFGAGLMEMRKFSIASFDSSFITAFVSSFVFGILSIKFLLSYLKKNNLTPFVIYRIILGCVVIAKYFIP
ncbi:MAG: undecaprenyl-diphosphate phosphatase [Elusimicrobiales bacterium]|nr:undecaprenyl-diphosphate phosphatase [Elusimicrobiales bacterium]NLH38736.1 undecaprenyl-diphosphate phosphatase [Elusimicrobiota bacterium]